jgi:hypothetical protein
VAAKLALGAATKLVFAVCVVVAAKFDSCKRGRDLTLLLRGAAVWAVPVVTGVAV